MYRIRTLTKDVQERIINKKGLITFSALKQVELQNLFTLLLTRDGQLLKKRFFFKAIAYFLPDNIIPSLTPVDKTII